MPHSEESSRDPGALTEPLRREHDAGKAGDMTPYAYLPRQSLSVLLIALLALLVAVADTFGSKESAGSAYYPGIAAVLMVSLLFQVRHVSSGERILPVWPLVVGVAVIAFLAALLEGLPPSRSTGPAFFPLAGAALLSGLALQVGAVFTRKRALSVLALTVVVAVPWSYLASAPTLDELEEQGAGVAGEINRATGRDALFPESLSTLGIELPPSRYSWSYEAIEGGTNYRLQIGDYGVNGFTMIYTYRANNWYRDT